MEKLAIKEVEIGRLALPGDFRARVKLPRVAERARSIDDLALLQLPIVRKVDMKLISGTDRVAAHVHLGREVVEVQLVDCTDAELDEIRLTENVQRRHDPVEQREGVVELVKLYEAQVALDATPAEPVPGKHNPAKAAARAKVAKQKGINPESVRKAEQRARKKAAAGRKPADLALLGIAVPDQDLAHMLSARDYMTEASNKMKAAKAALSGLDNSDVLFPRGRWQQIYEQVSDAALFVRNAIPTGVCPYCKLIPLLRAQCAGCQATGYITHNQNDGVPPELLDQADHHVVWGGQLLTYDEAAKLSATEGQPVVAAGAPITEEVEVVDDPFGMGG
jgi:ParB-like chromosome segregation protein Spo0J